MRFGTLGPLTVWTDAGEIVTIPGVKVRALLADLLANEGRVVSVDRLVEDLWGDDPPGNPAAALQVRVSQLRRALEEAEPGGKALVVSRAPGYQLRVEPEAVDAARFARLLADKRLAEALDLWRGAAYADFADFEFARPVITRLEEARLSAAEELAETRLAAGETMDVAELVAEHPLRERLRAVHMKALYRAGRQSDALAAYGELRERLAEELGLDPSPELAELHAAILRQDPALRGPAPRRTTNLPAPVSGLIGREEAVTEVSALLGGDRLVTLTGPGGVGKTRLALEIAARLAGDHADGVWLVELAAYDRDTGSPADAVLAALDIRDGAGPGDPAERLVDALRDRRLLLVLDNCEHVVDQAAKLAEALLRSAPGLRVLATSREPLCVAGEVLYGVPPLVLPEGGDLGEVAGSEAVRLFVARATASARGFTLNADNAPVVAQLVRRLDGLPLALELAATRVRALGVEELVARLDDRFRVLSGWQRGAPARQQTLSAMIDWSWTLLSDAERVVLRRLSVQADGCTLESAEVVCGDGDPGLDVMDLVTRLVDRSLVTVVAGPSGVRYRLLESVAAYCRRRLEDAGEAERIRRAYVECYVALAVRAEAHLRGPAQAEWLRLLDAETANLRGALDAAPAADALRLVNALAWYWYLRGRLREARRALDIALAAPGPAPDADRAKAAAWHAAFTRMLGEDADHEAALRAVHDPRDLAHAQWLIALTMTDLPAARALAERALATFRELDDRWGVAAALIVLAREAFTLRDHAELERTGLECERLFGELGDRWGRLQATEWLGGLAEFRGERERAERLFTEGLAIAEELGLWQDAAARLSWLGWGAMMRADYGQAMDHSTRALRLALSQGNRQGKLFAQMGLGFAARRAGLLEVAEEHLNSMLEGVPRGPGVVPELHLPTVLIELGFISERRDDPDTARELFLEAHAAAWRIGDPFTVASAVSALAAVAEPAEAARLLGIAQAARTEHGTPAAASDIHEEDRVRRRAEQVLGAESFTAAYAVGLGQRLQDALPSAP
ncbi:BTAD domain-containing putative transcriptional regulator [Spongiactinospora sp. TRM90649]|uniref:BTAD domain-containing putative transcriptional regulator n=1 Tax=Spongiactinospora sp. TRM90649 TaxID=3031114 RepID=UPI0023F650C4|nr:BTAD domain-containing putative transcriptional regulator [Spongiactinospora sp. TRM90649]MDF5757208.1 BTAD domain-containing putative transcriptional regulator [Spongiactinospora sp. TRM90649]